MMRSPLPQSCLRYQRCFHAVELLAGQQPAFQHYGKFAKLVDYRCRRSVISVGSDPGSCLPDGTQGPRELDAQGLPFGVAAEQGKLALRCLDANDRLGSTTALTSGLSPRVTPTGGCLARPLGRVLCKGALTCAGATKTPSGLRMRSRQFSTLPG